MHYCAYMWHLGTTLLGSCLPKYVWARHCTVARTTEYMGLICLLLSTTTPWQGDPCPVDNSQVLHFNCTTSCFSHEAEPPSFAATVTSEPLPNPLAPTSLIRTLQILTSTSRGFMGRRVDSCSATPCAMNPVLILAQCKHLYLQLPILAPCAMSPVLSYTCTMQTHFKCDTLAPDQLTL